ncbi:MAG: hypothetical protein GY790_02550 [Bacteroidetes bacterium]|nr:hypothetical protein [Bacteroidota bacterium]
MMKAQTERSKYRETLLVIVLGFSLLYLILDREWMLYVALGTGIIGMLSMKLNQWIHQGWLFIGEKLGFVVNKLVMGALYVAILLPISMLARIFRKDVMHLKPSTKSGFHKRDHLYEPDDLENTW